MSTRERILAIRLLEKAAKHPDYIKRLGIEAGTIKAEAGGRQAQL